MQTDCRNGKDCAKSRPKSKNAKVRVNTEESAVKPEPELKNTIECNLNPSDGPGKPNSITMKTVKTKWALNQLQQPICSLVSADCTVVSADCTAVPAGSASFLLIGDKECEELKAKCEAAMANFDNNPVVNVLRQKIKSLSREVMEHKAILDRMLPAASYQENLATLESKVATLEAKNGRAKVVTKVVPYVAMEFMHSDEIAMLVRKLVSSVVFYGRCAAFEEVADMKEPFDLAKVKVVADPFVSVEALLSKMPQSCCRLTLTKTYAPTPLAHS
ncbi:hypothetical protein Tco_0397312 [Tanacetum coccineum]